MPAAVKKIGIGAGLDAGKVIDSACRVSVPCEIICYLHPGAGRCLPAIEMYGFLESNEPETALVADVMCGAIDAAVQGRLPANATLQALKAAAGVTHLERVALLETAAGKKFF